MGSTGLGALPDPAPQASLREDCPRHTRGAWLGSCKSEQALTLSTSSVFSVLTDTRKPQKLGKSPCTLTAHIIATSQSSANRGAFQGHTHVTEAGLTWLRVKNW